MRRWLIIAALLGFAGSTPAAASEPALIRSATPKVQAPSGRCPAGTLAWTRAELYLGAGRVDAPAVTDADWQTFLAEEVTPRFPDGLTVLDAYGQWRAPDGVIVKERSRVLVILVRPSRAAERRIEQVRAVYKVRFKQKSVLRTDSPACVSF
jgi:hypothetical protein